jgi:ribosomal protein S27E
MAAQKKELITKKTSVIPDIEIYEPSICDYCNKDVYGVEGCSAKYLIPKYSNKAYVRSTYHFDEENGRCNDCNSKHGTFHHPGCDVERCPICGGQFISCMHGGAMECKITDSPNKKKVTTKWKPWLPEAIRELNEHKDNDIIRKNSRTLLGPKYGCMPC